MHLAVLDCETWLRGAGGGAPPLVCFGWAQLEDGLLLDSGLVTHKGEYTNIPAHCPRLEADPSLVDPSTVVRRLFAWVRENDGVFGNHNIPFDFAVLCQFDESLLEDVFAMYDDKLIEDTMLRESLMDIAAGSLGYWRDGRRSAKGKQVKKKYGLASLVKFYLGKEMDKTTHRKGYKALHDVPLAGWDQGAVDYGVGDAVDTGLLYYSQRADVSEDVEDGDIPNSPAQARAHWALHLSTIWGIRTDKKRVQKLKHELEVTYKILTQALKKVGFVRDRGAKEGSKNLTEIKTAMLELADGGFDLLLTDAAEKDKITHETLLSTENPLKYLSTSKEAISDLTDWAGFGLASIDEGESNDLNEDAAQSPLELGLLLAQAQLASEEKITLEVQQHLLPLVPLHTSVVKLLTTYVPALETGFKHPINAE